MFYKDFFIKKSGIALAIMAGAVPVVFLAVFYFYPLSGIFIRSFLPDAGFNGSVFTHTLHSRRILGIIWFTFWQAGVSTVLTLLTALPCAYVMSNFSFRLKKIMMGIATIPFVLPTIVVAAAFQALTGSNGVLGHLRVENSLYLILAAHVFYNFSIVLRITSGYWSYIRKEMTEAGYMLGANPFQVFFRITLPLLKPALFASSVLVFIFCFSSFGVILILGGPHFATIEVEIYRQAAHLFNLPMAAVLSMIQIVFTFALMGIYTSFQKRASKFLPESKLYPLKKAETITEKIMVGSCVIFILLFCSLPLAALIFKSIWFNGFSLVFYRELFTNTTGSIFYISPIKAAMNSVIYASATLVMAVIAGLCAASAIKLSKGKIRAVMDPVFMLPLSTSAVTLGFGIIITLDKPPLNLRTSPMLVPFVHTLVAFPFVVRAVLPVLRSIPDSLKEAGAILGASPVKSWFYVELPIIKRAVTAGALFAFTVSLGEFGATLFTARPEYSTLPVAIYRFLGQPGIMNYGQAMAVSSILMFVTAAGFLVIENLRTVGSEGF